MFWITEDGVTYDRPWTTGDDARVAAIDAHILCAQMRGDWKMVQHLNRDRSMAARDALERHESETGSPYGYE